MFDQLIVITVIAALVAFASFVAWRTQPRLQRSQPLRWTLIISTAIAGLGGILLAGALMVLWLMTNTVLED